MCVSSDHGVTWQQTAEMRWARAEPHDRRGPWGPDGPKLNWPQLLKTSKGVYIMGTNGVYRDPKPNDIVISKLVSEDCANWTLPVSLTSGYTIVTANTGVDVSAGRITKVAPS